MKIGAGMTTFSTPSPAFSKALNGSTTAILGFERELMSTKNVADFVADLKFDRIPADVIDQAKKGIRDVIGVMIASNKDKAVEAARRLALARGGKEESTLIGTGRKAPCEMVALVNAALATTLDLDDGSMGLPGHPRFHRGHPGGMIIASALAVAEREGKSGRDLIEAVVAGYEVELNTAWLVGEAVLAGRTATYGIAAAAAKLLGLTREEILHALCIAEAHCPWPTYAFVWRQTHMTKEAPSWAAMTGVMAAFLAQAGFKGAPTLYDLPNANPKPAQALGKEWEILGIYFKPHCTCRVGHAAIDGTLEILKEHRLGWDRVSKVTVGCSAQKSLNMGNYRPANIWQAQYSIPFAIGSALVDGEAGPGQISEERLGDSLILKNADKVVLALDPEVDALLPAHFAAKVEVETTEGQRFQVFKRYPKGEPENPMSEQELSRKFMKLSTPVLGKSKAEDLAKTIEKLETLNHVRDFVRKIETF
jgi:2-methylcitrate dehydratase PrpD